MPSKSAKQHRFMAAIANNPAFAKKVGIKSSVGEEFIKADRGRKFGSGGMTRPDVQKVNKPKTQHGKMALFKEGGDMAESKAMAKKEISFMKKKGAPASMVKHEKAEYGMKKGGIATSLKAHAAAPASKAHGMKSGGMAASKMGAVKTAAPSINGVATKGKTKGTMITMKRGGKTC
jgi:hypothetical protein